MRDRGAPVRAIAWMLILKSLDNHIEPQRSPQLNSRSIGATEYTVGDLVRNQRIVTVEQSKSPNVIPTESGRET